MSYSIKKYREGLQNPMLSRIITSIIFASLYIWLILKEENL